MKMVLAKLKILTLKVHTTVFDDYYGDNANEICMIEDFGPVGETTSRSSPHNHNDA